LKFYNFGILLKLRKSNSLENFDESEISKNTHKLRKRRGTL